MMQYNDTLCAMYRSHAHVCETIRHHTVALSAMRHDAAREGTIDNIQEYRDAIRHFEEELVTLQDTEKQLRTMINDQEGW